MNPLLTYFFGPETVMALFTALVFLFCADAPIEAWLNYTIPGTPKARIAGAVERIASRPNYLAELAAVMVGYSDEFTVMALELMAHLPRR